MPSTVYDDAIPDEEFEDLPPVRRAAATPVTAAAAPPGQSEHEYDEYEESDSEETLEVPQDPDLTLENHQLRVQYHVNEYHTRCWGTPYVDFTKGPDTWRWLRLPGYRPVQVSDAGYIRDPHTHAVTNGFSMAGTPYRVYILKDEFSENTKTIPVHEMVWEAFRGNPPPGYHVGHTHWALKEKDAWGKLPTDLGSLDIFPVPTHTHSQADSTSWP